MPEKHGSAKKVVISVAITTIIYPEDEQQLNIGRSESRGSLNECQARTGESYGSLSRAGYPANPRGQNSYVA
jgi:hypothetical protein